MLSYEQELVLNNLLRQLYVPDQTNVNKLKIHTIGCVKYFYGSLKKIGYFIKYNYFFV
jgi:hypothetical protein